MDIAAAATPDAMRTALQGFIDQTARLQGAAETVAAGGLDPAVILDIRSAEVNAAAAASVAKADQQNFDRLLDVLA